VGVVLSSLWIILIGVAAFSLVSLVISSFTSLFLPLLSLDGLAIYFMNNYVLFNVGGDSPAKS